MLKKNRLKRFVSLVIIGAIFFLPQADPTFRTGVVYTVDSKNTISQAVAIRGGKLIAVFDGKNNFSSCLRTAPKLC